MKSAPQQARAIRKRNALLKAAFEEFSEQGFEATTAKSIAQRAQVATGTFYQHFHNKDDVLVAIARHRFEQLQNNLDIPDVALDSAVKRRDEIHQVFRDALIFIYDFHSQESGFHEVLEHRRRVDPALAEVVDSGESVLLDRTRQFVARYVRDEVETTAFCLFAMAEGLVHRHVFQGHDGVGREQVIERGVLLLAAYFEQQANRG